MAPSGLKALSYKYETCEEEWGPPAYAPPLPEGNNHLVGTNKEPKMGQIMRKLSHLCRILVDINAHSAQTSRMFEGPDDLNNFTHHGNEPPSFQNVFDLLPAALCSAVRMINQAPAAEEQSRLKLHKRWFPPVGLHSQVCDH